MQTAADATVLGYLAAAAVALLARAHLGGAWLAVHLLLLGAVSNAIVAYSERFSLALLRARPPGPALPIARLALLNAGVLAVLAGLGLHAGPGLLAAGALLVAAVVAGHAARLGRLAAGAFTRRFGVTVWYYLAAAGALVAGIGAGLLLGAGAVAGAQGYRALRLAHVHLNLLGWVGLSVLGTQVTLWPTMLRTRIDDRAALAAARALPLLVVGVAAAAVGFAAGWRPLAAAGLAAYAAGALWLLAPSVRLLRRGHGAGAGPWLLAAALAWLLAAVLVDLAVVAATPELLDVDARLGRLLPVVTLGFAGQAVAGALTWLLPVAWGGGPQGNRRLARVLDTGWRGRLAAVNLGVALAAAVPGGTAGRAGWWLAAARLGGFVVLAAATLAWHLVERVDPGPPYRSRGRPGS